ncbi:hypothetical protein V6N13_016529 [Hibiscus sabdariffa]|uniref:WRKY domain-containing protein n=2 Tax=Hibiscus sabdariffa TaxID=183260 RepID=A0ABR2ANZ8_9ROSI
MATLHPWPDQTLSSNKTRVIRELVQGQKCAAELQMIVDQEHSQQGSSPEELVQKILTCFDQTISMMQDACNTPAPAAVSKDRRGCYKRKRGAETWTIVSDKMEDDHAWRKYGQKTILNSEHPRSYFRCKHKCDQGCRAIKQVQRTEDDDSKMYHITYIGTHTCRDSSPHDMVPSNNSGILFDGSSPTLKHEYEEEMTPSDVTELDSMTMWEDVVLGGDGFESMYGDVVSDMYSCNEVSCLNLEPIGLENGFQLDDSEFV